MVIDSRAIISRRDGQLDGDPLFFPRCSARTRDATILIGFDKTSLGIRVAISLNDAVNISVACVCVCVCVCVRPRCKKGRKGDSRSVLQREECVLACTGAVRVNVRSQTRKTDLETHYRDTLLVLVDPLTWHAQPIWIDALAFITAFLPNQRPPKNYLPFVRPITGERCRNVEENQIPGDIERTISRGTSVPTSRLLFLFFSSFFVKSRRLLLLSRATFL